jgi:L-aspartate oxidase
MGGKKGSNADFVILGGGIAGMRAAIELALSARVLVLTKGEVCESNSQQAQGGIAVALADDDEVSLHYLDTLHAGDGLCCEEAVRRLVEQGPLEIETLIEWGMKFDRNGSKLAFTREGAHSRSRVLHAHGDSTGAQIMRALIAKARRLPGIEIRPHAFALDLLKEGGAVAGVRCLDEKTGRVHDLPARAVLLATGGLGQVYQETTNPPVATGDGVALADRAGALLSDLEFIQFHPTALYVQGAPRFLLSEALRGEGGILRNILLERFMPRYHEAGELAPRDIVSRGIVMEMQKTRGDFVYLDLTGLDAEHLKKRFPTIYSTCLQNNLDITQDLIPVRPAAHYSMGGVATDLDGATSVAGLFAAGEVAATGVHGANRLASNSLLEGLVFGARAAAAMAMHARPARVPAAAARPQSEAAPCSAGQTNAPAPPLPPEKLIEEVRSILCGKVGILRNGRDLADAVNQLEALTLGPDIPMRRRPYEARNILTLARLIARCALARRESRGAHYRTDFPLKDDTRPPLHSYVRNDGQVFFAPTLSAPVGTPPSTPRGR